MNEKINELTRRQRGNGNDPDGPGIYGTPYATRNSTLTFATSHELSLSKLEPKLRGGIPGRSGNPYPSLGPV